MDKTTTRTATIFMDEHDILHMIMLKGVRLDFEDAVDNGLVIKSLTKGKKTLKLIDARKGFTMDKKARDFIKSVDAKQTIARAVVKGSIFSSLVLGFFTKLSQPKIPTKIFSDYDEAYTWLLGFERE